jgi:hypothetical protein
MLINNDLINVNHHHLRHKLFCSITQYLLAQARRFWLYVLFAGPNWRELETVISASSFLARHLSFTRFGDGLKVA